MTISIQSGITGHAVILKLRYHSLIIIISSLPLFHTIHNIILSPALVVYTVLYVERILYLRLFLPSLLERGILTDEGVR